jgi:hypothetical protein
VFKKSDLTTSGYKKERRKIIKSEVCQRYAGGLMMQQSLLPKTQEICHIRLYEPKHLTHTNKLLFNIIKDHEKTI